MSMMEVRFFLDMMMSRKELFPLDVMFFCTVAVAARSVKHF